MGQGRDHENPESEYDQLMRMITEYGAARYVAARAISQETINLRNQEASELLHDITVKLHRLYASLGHDV